MGRPKLFGAMGRRPRLTTGTEEVRPDASIALDRDHGKALAAVSS
jgi:hypothetical protein